MSVRVMLMWAIFFVNIYDDIKMQNVSNYFNKIDKSYFGLKSKMAKIFLQKKNEKKNKSIKYKNLKTKFEKLNTTDPTQPTNIFISVCTYWGVYLI